MAEIAAEAGVARATVFNHFSSKHALIEAFTEGVFAYYQGMLEKALADTRTATPTLVRALFSQMGVGIETSQRFFRSVFREIAKLQTGLDEGGAGQRAREAALVRLAKLLARGQTRRELASEHRAEDLAWAFDSLVNGTIIHWLYDDASQSLQQRMQRAAEIFLGPVALGARDATDPLPDLFPDGFEGWGPPGAFASTLPPNPELKGESA